MFKVITLNNISPVGLQRLEPPSFPSCLSEALLAWEDLLVHSVQQKTNDWTICMEQEAPACMERRPLAVPPPVTPFASL